MIKFIRNIAILSALFGLTGCYTPDYVDVKSHNTATIQLVPKSSTVLFSDDYVAFIYDYKKLISEKGCDYSGASLGLLSTSSDTNSRKIKVEANKPLRLNVNYKIRSGGSTSAIYTDIVLNPQRNKHYIIEYTRKEMDIWNPSGDFSVYQKRGTHKSSVPRSRIKEFDAMKECY